MRYISGLFGVVCCLAAALIYTMVPMTPVAQFVDNFTVNRFTFIATTCCVVAGLAFFINSALPKREKSGSKKSSPAPAAKAR